jgi:hypothetical protein
MPSATEVVSGVGSAIVRAFAAWMKARGMNDAQSKVPRLANDRRYTEGLG